MCLNLWKWIYLSVKYGVTIEVTPFLLLLETINSFTKLPGPNVLARNEIGILLS